MDRQAHVFLAALAVCGTVHAAVVDFDSTSDITNSFRELRANTNESHQPGVGSDGVNNGFFRYTAAADSGAIRFAYDENGASAGTTTFEKGYVATDVRYDTVNRMIGLWFGAPTDSLGWFLRLDNSLGSLENTKASYGINQTNNFSNGTTLTTTSGTSMIAGAASPGFTNGTSTDVYTNLQLSINNWYSMRLDFDIDGSNRRTLRYRIWDNVLNTGTGLGTGTLRLDQALTINGIAYNGLGEVGFFAAPNSTSTANIDLDNFTVVVPEPGSIALLAGGLAFLTRRRR